MNKVKSDKLTTGDVVKLKCGNCGNEWDYNGKHPFYATCTRCLRKVKIPKQEEKKDA